MRRYDKDRTQTPRKVQSDAAAGVWRLKAFQDYANKTGDLYLWEGTPICVKRRRILSPDQYEIVDVCTSRGVRRAMLIPKAILQAGWAIKRERLRAKRAAKPRSI